MQLLAKHKGSDMFLSAGAPPSLKIEGNTVHVGEQCLGPEQTRAMAYSIMSDKQQKEFEATMEMNLAVGL
ncbi:MAG: type IV pili twitching motility protein PilT, partial [Xanthomonadales bacterium]|nr:type IV pili twitching motility protein PilT [Xanthomonadales bacterium]